MTSILLKAKKIKVLEKKPILTANRYGVLSQEKEEDDKEVYEEAPAGWNPQIKQKAYSSAIEEAKNDIKEL